MKFFINLIKKTYWWFHDILGHIAIWLLILIILFGGKITIDLNILKWIVGLI